VTTVYPVIVIDDQSSSSSFHRPLSNCSSVASVHLHSVDEDVVSLSANKLHNCSGLIY